MKTLSLLRNCIFVVFLVTLSSISAFSQDMFAPPVNYAVGDSPASVFSIDFNGDGYNDLATSTWGSDNVSILLGYGDGTFQSAVNYDAGDYPNSVFSIDFDGDGDNDLAIANGYVNNVWILLGNGDGTFQSAVNYFVSGHPVFVFSIDFNGDGDNDLATANHYNDDVSILLGNGDGTFQSAFDYHVGDGPSSVFSIDFNGDGHNDLATANYSSDNISILLGDGDGTFQGADNYTAGDGPRSVFSIDLNGDGYNDLATANYLSDNVSILLGNGDGTFQSAVNYAAGSESFSVFLIDFNGDGNNDLATVDYNSANVSILLGNGDGTFQGAVNYAAGYGPRSVFSADLDGDGDYDLATANGNSDNVSVLINQTNPYGPPVSHILLDSISLFTLALDTTFTPTDLPAIEAGSNMRIFGRVLDIGYTGIPAKTVRCYDPITGDLFLGDSAVFRVTTDESGSFIYPDTLLVPDGISCDEVDQHGLWFNAGNAAIPLSVMLYEDCGGYDCLSDSLQTWLASSSFPEGTVVGTVDSLDELYTPIAPYPPVANDLSSPLNDEFFEGYAWSYSGDTVETFLHGPAGWLERGLVAHEQRTEAVVSTLKDYSQQSAANVRILAIRGENGWVMANEIDKALWPENLMWNIMSYGIEGAMCGVGLASVGGAFIGCAPLLISISADLTKKYVVPSTCSDELRDIEYEVCIATSESSIDVGAFVLTAAVSGGPQLAKHLGSFHNPGRLTKAARLYIALDIADDIHTFGEVAMIGLDVINTTFEHYIHPSTGIVQSYGFSNMTYVGSRIPMLQGQDLQVMTTLRNDFNIQPAASWDNMANPMFLNVAVHPDRGVYEDGPQSSIAPQCQVINQSIAYDITWDIEDHDNLIYSTSVPISSLPGFVAGQPYMASIVSSGSDLCSNNGTGNDQCMLNQCTVEGAVIHTPGGEGVDIPSSSVLEAIWVGIGSIFGGIGGGWKSSALLLDDDAVSGHVLNIQPDTIVLLNPATITVIMDTSDIQYLDSVHVLYMGRWNDSQGEWERLPVTLDSSTGMVTVVDTRFGYYAPIIAHNSGCCVGIRGNVDYVLPDEINIADLTYLVAYLFTGGAEPPCIDESDIDGNGEINIADLTYLVAYLFTGGPAPVACP
ncbi:MAG: VCBS repeat-containing protein [candidate division Zixibacteria bacterium]|nr:VCBS repeat-containing protein [candidate division Zixibacteria bacterium]